MKEWWSVLRNMATIFLFLKPSNIGTNFRLYQGIDWFCKRYINDFFEICELLRGGNKRSEKTIFTLIPIKTNILGIATFEEDLVAISTLNLWHEIKLVDYSSILALHVCPI